MTRIGDVQRSGGGYIRASRAEQAANYIADLGWPLGEPPSSGPGQYPINLSPVSFWGARHHAGIDVDTRRGTPIRAPIAGEVIRNRRGEDEGNYIAIQDARGRRHYFLHMMAPASPDLRPRTGDTPGTMVAKGQVLGYVGSTGRSDGMHLHYAIVLPNNHVLDPYPMLLAARHRENPPGVAGMRATVGQSAEDWRTLEILDQRIMARVNGWAWPAELLERVPDPSAERTHMRQLREGKQALMRDLHATFLRRRELLEYAPARAAVDRMQAVWSGFESFAASYAADANATFTENVTRGVDRTVTNVVDTATTAATNIGAGIFLIGLVGVGIAAAITATAHAHRTA